MDTAPADLTKLQVREPERGDCAPMGTPNGVIGAPDLLLLLRMVQATP